MEPSYQGALWRSREELGGVDGQLQPCIFAALPQVLP